MSHLNKQYCICMPSGLQDTGKMLCCALMGLATATADDSRQEKRAGKELIRLMLADLVKTSLNWVRIQTRGEAHASQHGCNPDTECNTHESYPTHVRWYMYATYAEMTLCLAHGKCQKAGLNAHAVKHTRAVPVPD